MNASNQLKILLVSSEVAPFAKAGEMAEVVAQLPKALKALGHDVRVVMPRYRWISREILSPLLDAYPVPLDQNDEPASLFQTTLAPGIPLYFVDNPRFFDREGLYMYPDDAERFVFFCRAAMEMLPRLDWQPDIIHSNGWQTAIIPNWLKTIYASNPFFQRTATLYTIHNLAHQGIFGEHALEISGLSSYGLISHPQVAPDINSAFDFMARGILFADGISTVSQNYAREIQTPSYGEKLDPILRMRSTHLRGILSGIDYASYSPDSDPDLERNFDADHIQARVDNKRALQRLAGLEENPEKPILAIASPLDDLHGLDVLSDVVDHLLELNLQLVLTGTGDQHYHTIYANLHDKIPKQFSAFFSTEDSLLRRIVAGSDMLLVPSRFEPDGRVPLLAMHYGCIPIARATGGLVDSVRDYDPQEKSGTGFVFRQNERWELYAAVVRALEAYRRPEEWRALQLRDMRADLSWSRAAMSYVDIYRVALDFKLTAVEREASLAREIERTAKIMAALPEPIRPLRDLAYNLWGGWHDDASKLFACIDPDIWERSNHNPVLLLRTVAPERLARISADPQFLEQLDRLITSFDQYMHPNGTWFGTTYPYAGDRTVAYFSAEFGLHEALPIYSGGLGILAGDHTKESSDLGVPLVGIGFLYPQGYFRQEVDAEGNQIAIYDKLNFAQVPAVAARDPNGDEVMVEVDLPGRRVHAKVWQIQVGRVPLYLMDTDVQANAEHDRQLAARLYGGDHEIRIMQEIVLGIGGVRVLRALGLNPSAYHMNEGHSTFLILELIRELVEAGHTFEQARQQVSAQSIFTVHTPVAAGNDAFDPELMDKYFGSYYPQLGLSREEFLNFARQDGLFSMTVLGLRGAGQRNGVSRLHGEVSRNMWQFVWPHLTSENVPIGHVTNGVHTRTWLSPELDELFKRHLGVDWYERLDDPSLWLGLREIDTPVWEIRKAVKMRLVEFIRRRAIARLERLSASHEQIEAAKHLLDPDALTIGFARRFATYKRATLIFRDIERLKRILNQPGLPVQVIFSGKAHPADEPGKDLIRAVIHYSKQPGLYGRVCFLEDYGIEDARMLVQGVDVWLNNPRRPLEASGTSGQKAALNGALNLSILDGWWIEGFDNANGWAIGNATRTFASPEAQDEADAQSLYSLLETQVVPLFYARGADGVPHAWVARSAEAIRSIAPAFSARRMLKEYVDRYLNAMIPQQPTVAAAAIR
jgi:glycogen phosphorylase